MTTFVGFVKKVNTKSGTNRNGRPYTLTSMKLQDENGNEVPGWFRNGFDRLPCNEGDYVKLDADEKNGNFEIRKGSIKIAPAGKAPAAPPAAPRGGGATQTGGGQTQKNIHYQNSRTCAVSVVEVLLANDALPMSAAKSKAGQSARYEAVTAMIDKLTVQYFNDLETFRLFDTVEDGRTETREVDTTEELPDREPGEDDDLGEDPFEAADSSDDDIPW